LHYQKIRVEKEITAGTLHNYVKTLTQTLETVMEGAVMLTL
jgi:hypothetical protein